MIKPGQGTYALIMKADTPFELVVGKMGLLKGRSGYYVYCGSAFGPGGIRARTTHHRKLAKKPHWHIDYLRPVADIKEIWFTYDPVKREHDWIRVLLGGKFIIPFKGFGSTDCTCHSHLVYSTEMPSYHWFTRYVHNRLNNHRTISGIKKGVEKWLVIA